MTNVRTNKNVFPQLGMAGVSLAGIFVCVSLSGINEKYINALWWFSVSLPLIISGAFLVYLAEPIESLEKSFSFVGRLIMVGGDVVSAIGIYWLISYASIEAANMFLYLSIGLYVVISSVSYLLRKGK